MRAGLTGGIWKTGAAMPRCDEMRGGGERRVDVDRATIERILVLPIDDDLPRELDEAEAPVGDPWPDGG